MNTGNKRLNLGPAPLLWLALLASASVTAPALCDEADLQEFEVRTGVVLEGGLPELQESDDARLVTRSGFGRTVADLHKMEMAIRFLTNLAEPEALTIGIESFLPEANGTAQISLLNQTTGAYDPVARYPIGPVEDLFAISDIPAGEYVGDQGEIEVFLKHVVFVPFLGYNFESAIDEVSVDVAPAAEPFPFSFPYDGGEHVLVDGLPENFPHTSFVISSDEANPAPFEIVAQDAEGQDVPNASLFLYPGKTALIDIDWAWRYVVRLPEIRGAFADGVAQNALNLKVETLSEEDCANKWHTVKVAASRREHCVTFRAWHETVGDDGEVRRTDSDCPLKAKWEVKVGQNQTHRTSGEVPVAAGASTELCEEIDDIDRNARRIILFQVKCESARELKCRITIAR